MSILLNTSSPSLLYDRDPYAHNITKDFQNDLIKRGGVNIPVPLPPILPQLSPSIAAGGKTGLIPTKQIPAGILGGGAGGLYAAFKLILDSLGIPYKILEARDDVGGRLFTYRFPEPTGSPYNYFDVGAVRYPKVEAMPRVFNLFEYPPLNTGDIQLKAKLGPYFFVNENTCLDHNGVTVRRSEVPPSGDPFKSAYVMQDTNADPYTAAGAKAIIDDVIEPFTTGLLNDLKTGKNDGWNCLMKYDDYSTRSYMAVAYIPSDSLKIPKQPLPTDVINRCETFDTSAGWYDRLLAENVLEAIAFGWQPGSGSETRPTEWFSI